MLVSFLFNFQPKILAPYEKGVNLQKSIANFLNWIARMNSSLAEWWIDSLAVKFKHSIVISYLF